MLSQKSIGHLSANCPQTNNKQSTKGTKKRATKNVELERMKGESSTGFEPMTANYQAGALFSELRRTYAERGHVLGSY